MRFILANYALTLEVRPSNPDHLLIGSVTAGVSYDAGNSWDRIPQSHFDYHTLTNYRNGSGDFLVGNDGGVYRYSWNMASDPDDLNETYQVTQFYAGHYYPKGNPVIGGTQDNGTQRLHDGRDNVSFQKIFGADGSYCAVNQAHPDTGYISTQRGKIRKSSNMRGDEPDFRAVYDDMDQNRDGEIDDRVWFINPFQINPKANDQLYFTTKSKAWISTNSAEDWRPMTNRLFRGTPYNTTISKDARPVAFVHGNNALFYRMDDPLNDQPGDEVSLRSSVPLDLKRDFFKTLKVHPDDSTILYGGFSNFEEEPRIWQITEAMSADPEWESIHGDLPTMLGVNTLVIDPDQPDSVIVAGTDFGLYVTRNRGQNWVKEKAIPNVAIHQLRIRPSDRQLFIYTHGRGIWKADMPSIQADEEPQDPPDSTKKDPVEAFYLYPNPTSGVVNLAIPGVTQFSAIRVNVISLTGQVMAEHTFTEPKRPSINLATLPSAPYQLVVETPAKTYHQKVIKF